MGREDGGMNIGVDRRGKVWRWDEWNKSSEL